ncbi:MAG: MFS transporter, partial [Thermaerobacterales bacterium]
MNIPGQRPPVRTRRFYGWTVALVAGLTLFFSGPGQTPGVAIFVDPLIDEFGWTRTMVSTMYSSGTLAAGLCMTLVGRLIDRYGYRSSLSGIVFLFSGALLFMSFVINPMMLLAGFFMVRLFGQGSMTLVPYSLIPQWFVAARGRALGFVALGSALSIAFIPYINVILIDLWGWRLAWQIWALIMAAVMLPVVWVFTRDRPEQIGQRPDGVAPPVSGSTRGSKRAEEESWTIKEAMGTSAFWIILLVTAIPPVVSTGLIFHHTSIMAGNGLSTAVAASVFTVSAAVALPTTVLAGYMCDRLPVRLVLIGTFILYTLNVLFLFWTVSPVTAVMLGAFRGFTQAFMAITGGVIWPQWFGRRNLASIRGAVTTAMVLGSALGPLPMGIAYDWFGGYREAILAMAGLSLSGVAGLLLLRPPSKAGLKSHVDYSQQAS